VIRPGHAKLKDGRVISFGLTIEAWDDDGGAVIVATLLDRDLDFVLAEDCSLKAYPAALAKISEFFGSPVTDSLPPSVAVRASPLVAPCP